MLAGRFCILIVSEQSERVFEIKKPQKVRYIYEENNAMNQI